MTQPPSPCDARSGAASRSSDTRERILDAAECLFASAGIESTSLRAITRTACVNLAAVHYHFGSKDRLLDAVVERRARPVGEAQAARLEKLALNDSTSVLEILHALLEPVAESHRASDQGPILSALLSRIQAQRPEVVERLFREHFGETGRSFVDALQRALPDYPRHIVADRFRFALGVVTHVFSGAFALDTIPGHPSPSAPGANLNNSDLYDELISFLAAGLEAPTASDSQLQPADASMDVQEIER